MPLSGYQRHVCDVNAVFHFAPWGMALSAYEHVALMLEILDLT